MLESKVNKLPWSGKRPPLMLAPMQGLTNRAMRGLFIDWVRPDVVFTEFMRVSGVSRKRLNRSDLRDAAAEEKGVPLVVQLVGHGRRPLVEAAQFVQDAGARHINLNLGCPYGRMTSAATGGKLLQHPKELTEIIPALREVITGSFSIKLRAGYDDPQQVFCLLALFESTGVDFLILHPRTVAQEYRGDADHTLTADLVRQGRLPVIANGDIKTATQGLHVLKDTGAAGLMLGRAAIADPLLFSRLRNGDTTQPTTQDQVRMLRRYLLDLTERYSELFCGPTQILSKLKGVLPFLTDPAYANAVQQLKRTRSLEDFQARIEII